MKKTTKKTAVAVVGILSAVAVGSGVAAINATATKPVLANGNHIAYAAEATQLEQFVAQLKTIADTVNGYADDNAFFDMNETANVTVAQTAYVLHGTYILNLNATDRAALATAYLYEEGEASTATYKTAKALFDKLEAVYGNYYTIVDNLKAYVTGSGDAVKCKTLSWGEKATVEAAVAAYDNATTQQATMDVFAAIDNKPVANIKSAISTYFGALDTQIGKAEQAIENLYKHDNGDGTSSVVLGSNDADFAHAASKTTLDDILKEIKAIYNTSGLPSVTEAEDERVYNAVKSYETLKGEYEAIFTELQAIATHIDGVFDGFNADTSCYTYEYAEASGADSIVSYVAGANKITVARNLYATLVDSEDNKLKSTFDTTHADTLADLNTMAEAYDATKAKVEALSSKISTIKTYTADELYNTKRAEVTAARNDSYVGLPSELKFHVAVEGKYVKFDAETGAHVATSADEVASVAKYVTNYADLITAEATIADMDKAVEDLKAYVLTFEGDFKAGKFTKNYNLTYQSMFSALNADQKAKITGEKISVDENALTYAEEAQRVFDAYDEVLIVVGPIITAINNLPPVEDIDITDTTEIHALYNPSETNPGLYQTLDDTTKEYITNYQTLKDAYDALSDARTDLNAWIAKANALDAEADITCADKDAIDAVTTDLNAFDAGMKTYITTVSEVEDADTYAAYAKYSAAYEKMYNETDGIWTVVVDTVTKMAALPDLAADADTNAIADFNSKYQAVDAQYAALHDDSKTAVQTYEKAEDAQYGAAYQEYLDKSPLGQYYAMEALIEQINVAFGGSATAYATDGTPTFTKGTIDLSVKAGGFTTGYEDCNYNIEVLAVVKTKVDAYYTEFDAEKAKPIRNQELLNTLMSDYEAFENGYKAIDNSVRVALGNKAATEEGTPVSTKLIELTGGTDTYASIETIKAYFTSDGTDATLSADEVAYMGYKYHLYLTAVPAEDTDPAAFAIVPVETAINEHLAQINTAINDIIAKSSANTLTQEDIEKMNAIIADCNADPAVYAATQLAKIENIDQLETAQNTADLVNYIKEAIDSLNDNLATENLTAEGAALAQVIKVLYTNQAQQIKTLVGKDYEEKLVAVIDAYEKAATDGTLIDAKDIIANVDALDTALDQVMDGIIAAFPAESDAAQTLTGALADLATLVQNVATNAGDIANIEDIISGEGGLIDEITDLTNKIYGSEDGTTVGLLDSVADIQADIQAAIEAYNTANGTNAETLNAILADSNARLTKVIADLNATKTALEAKDVELNEAILSLKGKLETLQGSYDAYVSKNDTEIAAIKTGIETLKNSLEADIEKVAADLAAVKIALEAKDQQLATNISKLEGDLAQAKAALDAKDIELENKINDLTDALAEAKGGLTATIIVFSVLLAGAAAAIVLLFLKKQSK